jgi:hypothetical protein
MEYEFLLYKQSQLFTSGENLQFDLMFPTVVDQGNRGIGTGLPIQRVDEMGLAVAGLAVDFDQVSRTAMLVFDGITGEHSNVCRIAWYIQPADPVYQLQPPLPASGSQARMSAVMT